MLMKFHYLPISDRDVICEGIGYHIQDENAFLLLTKSIDSSPFCDIPPKSPRVVRMETRTAFFIKLLPGCRVEFCQISHDDLKFKYVPAFVTNFLLQGAVPFELIQSMKQTMSNYNGLKWDERMKKGRDFYAEIKERVHEEVEVINNLQRSKMMADIVEEEQAGIPLEWAICAMAFLAGIT